MRGRPETLHHLLVTLAFHAVEEARPRGHVRVAASQVADSRGAFVVEDDGARDDSLLDGDVGMLTGRGLARASAALILARIDGRVLATRDDDRTCVSLALPLFE